jgi:hypothetical protein
MTKKTRSGDGGATAGSPKRVQLSRRAGWRMPENTVKVSRPGKWGNPYRVGEDVPGLSGEKMDREDAVMYHRLDVIRWSEDRVNEAVRELRGKNLACWCPLDQPCHADTLLELAND